MTTNFPKPLDKQVAAISDSLSQTQDGLAIVANGNTHAAISSGQFVYVKGHDTLPEGLYKATSAIAANGTLSTSNLTPDGSGGLNDLQGQLTTLNSKITNIAIESVTSQTSDANGSIVSPILKNTIIIDYAFSNGYLLIPYKAKSSAYWKFLVCDVNPTTGAIEIQKNISGTLTVHYLAHPV